MQLDSTLVLALGGLFGLVVAMVTALCLVLGAALWGWSWASRFDSLGASRDDDGTVLMSARLKPKQMKKTKPRLVAPSNGVRKVVPKNNGQEAS